MRARLAAARGALDRGHYSADWMVEIEALGREMNTLYLGRRLEPFAKKQSPMDLRQALDRVVADQSTIHWPKAMSASVPLLTNPAKPRKPVIQARDSRC